MSKFKFKETALLLPSKYEHCLVGVKDGLAVYDKQLVIDTLQAEYISDINAGIIKRDSELDSVEIQAYFLALEMFYHNMDVYLKDSPIFTDRDKDE